MAYKKITDADLIGIGVIGLADTPELSTTEMQEKFEETARTVIIPHINTMVEQLNDDMDSIYTKAETENRISEKLIEVGAGDMSKKVYDTNGNGVVDNAEKLGGQLPSYYATKADTVPKTGGEFTGDISVSKTANSLKVSTNSSGVDISSTYRPTLSFTGDDKQRASIFTDDSAGYRLALRTFPPDYNSDKTNSVTYLFPIAEEGRASAANYDVLTSRNAVTVGQGGTGATTAAGALANLGAIPKAGGTFTGPITLYGAPTSDLQPATKKYVDDIKTAIDSSVNEVKTTANNAMPKAGGTFSGSLNMAAGKRIDFINKDGYRLRILGGEGNNTTNIRVVNGSGNTLAELLAVDTSTGNITGGKLAKGTDLLWENASPTSSFSGQDVNITDLAKKYVGVWIVYRFDTADDTRYSVYIATNTSARASVIVAASSIATQYMRTATAWSTKVTFGNAFQIGGTQNNNFAIPVAIYGIK